MYNSPVDSCGCITRNEGTSFFEHTQPIALGIDGPQPICETCQPYLEKRGATMISDHGAIGQ